MFIPIRQCSRVTYTVKLSHFCHLIICPINAAHYCNVSAYVECWHWQKIARAEIVVTIQLNKCATELHDYSYL
jgi:hypothetical protein